MPEIEMRKLQETSAKPFEIRISYNRKHVELATGFNVGDDVYVVYEPGVIFVTKEIKDVVIDKESPLVERGQDKQ